MKEDELFDGAKKVYRLSEKLDSMGNDIRNRKQKKLEEKEKKRLEKQEILKNKDTNTKKLLMEASFSEMNWQQIVFVVIRLIFYAGMPFFIYMFMPAIVIAAGTAIFTGSIKNLSESYSVSAQNFYTFVGIICALIFIFRSAKKRGSTVAEDITISFKDLNWKYIGMMFLFGIASSICISALLTLIPDMFMQRYDSYTMDVRNAYDIPMALISVALLDPIAEEIVFRGYMLNRLLPTLKERASIWTVTIIFSLCHLSIFWIFYGVALGWVLAKISVRHDNIMYSIAIHMGFNLPVVLNYLISNNETANNLLFGNKLLICGYAIIFAAISYGLIVWYDKAENLGLNLLRPKNK